MTWAEGVWLDLVALGVVADKTAESGSPGCARVIKEGCSCLFLIGADW